MKKSFLKKVIISATLVSTTTIPVIGSLFSVNVHATGKTLLTTKVSSEAKNKEPDTKLKLIGLELGTAKLLNVLNIDKLEIKCDKFSPQEINTTIRFYVDEQEDRLYRFSIEDEEGVKIEKDYSSESFVDNVEKL